MNTKEKALNNKLKIFFAIAVFVPIILLLYVLSYTVSRQIDMPNVALERYGIIITLIGIPLALKIFHSQVKKQDKSDIDKYSKTYFRNYIIRLCILIFVCLFNILSLYITGAKNFIFMSVITIFAFFLCMPQKIDLEARENEDI